MRLLGGVGVLRVHADDILTTFSIVIMSFIFVTVWNSLPSLFPRKIYCFWSINSSL